MSVAPPRTLERPTAAKRAARKATRRRGRPSPFGPLLGFFGTRPGAVTLVAMLFALALRKAKVPLELHVFEKGRHGLGLGGGDPAFAAWPKLCEAWLRGQGFLAK